MTMRFSLMSLAGLLLIVGSFGQNLRGQKKDEIELLEQIRDRVKSLNDKINYHNHDFEIIDEYEVPEKNVVKSDEHDRTEDRLKEIRDRIKYLNNKIESVKAEDSVEEEDAESLDGFKTDEAKVEDETNPYYERLDAIRNGIDFLKNEINAGLEEEENFRRKAITPPSKIFEVVEDPPSAEVVDESKKDNEADLRKRISSINEKIVFFKNKINAGLEEEENFRLIEKKITSPSKDFEAVEDSSSAEVRDESKKDNEADLSKRISSINEKIVFLKNKISAGHEEEENLESDEHASPSDDLKFEAVENLSSEEYDDESKEKLNDLRDRIKILGDKIIGKVEDKAQGENIVAKMGAYSSGSIDEKKEFQDYEREKQINILKEKLHDTIKNVGLEGENDFF